LEWLFSGFHLIRGLKYSDSKFRNVKYEGQIKTTTEGNTGDELHQKPFAADMEAFYRFFSNSNLTRPQHRGWGGGCNDVHASRGQDEGLLSIYT